MTRTSQTPIPCLCGGSKGPIFKESELPVDVATRDRVLLAIGGSPDKRSIEGLGGVHPLTSTVGIVRPGTVSGIDLNFLFAPLQQERDPVETMPNCGNLLAHGVSRGDSSTFRALMRR